MRSGKIMAALLLLVGPKGRASLLAWARGLSALVAGVGWWVPLRDTVRLPWLGPGLLLALVLLISLLARRGTPDEEPVHRMAKRSFRAPRIEEFRRLPPRNHSDLEV